MEVKLSRVEQEVGISLANMQRFQSLNRKEFLSFVESSFQLKFSIKKEFKTYLRNAPLLKSLLWFVTALVADFQEMFQQWSFVVGIGSEAHACRPRMWNNDIDLRICENESVKCTTYKYVKMYDNESGGNYAKGTES